MSQRSAKDMADLLWRLISNNGAFRAFKVPEDRAEILEQLAERLDEEINQLMPESDYFLDPTNALL